MVDTPIDELEYKLSSDGGSYSMTGVVTNNATEVIVLSIYEWKVGGD